MGHVDRHILDPRISRAGLFPCVDVEFIDIYGLHPFQILYIETDICVIGKNAVAVGKQVVRQRDGTERVVGECVRIHSGRVRIKK